MTPRPAFARPRPLLLASSVTSSVILSGMSLSAAVFGWTGQAITLGAVAVAGWGGVAFLAVRMRPGTARREGMRELLEATPPRREAPR